MTAAAPSSRTTRNREGKPPRSPLPAVSRSAVMPRWKRALDLAVAGSTLVALTPLFAVLTVIVRLDSRGPSFFAQTRIGLNGEPFTCWKFRSMYTDAEERLALLADRNEAAGPLFKMRDDPRCTRSGRFLRKTSLDELPQLWNVLVGDMSLVGPRPPLPSEVQRYEHRHYRRLRGVPGITGLWQVRARERHNFEEMVELDVEYLDHVSLASDLRILASTIPVVLRGSGSH